MDLQSNKLILKIIVLQYHKVGYYMLNVYKITKKRLNA